MKNKKQRSILLIAMLFSFVFFANASADSIDGHLAFRRKGKGACHSLNGQITMRIVYVNTADGVWTEEEKADWRSTVNEAIAMIDDAAETYDKNVKAECIEYEVYAADDEIVDYNEFVMDCLLQNEEMQKNVILLENEENVFTVFCFLNERRSFAYADWDGMLSESIIANSHDLGVELMHEIMHLFGAADLYFPDEFKQSAMLHFPDSIMMSTAGECAVDSLTAYSIGWTEVLDDTALRFLKDTENVTPDMLEMAYEEELYTGFGIKQHENYTHYGYFENGLLHGHGICRWENGDWYAGEFVSGKMHGQGSYHWAAGTVYTGNYEYGKRTGQGSIVWNNGSMYVGSFENGKITGEGMYTWPDGSCYSGSLQDGIYHGYGTYTDASGCVTAGYWQNGRLCE